MIRNILFIFAVLMIFIQSAASAGIYTLKNRKIEVSVDNAGNLVALKNLQTGLDYASGKPLWRLYFDKPNDKDIEIAAPGNTPVVTKSDDAIMISYGSLRVRSESMKFSLKLKISLEEQMVRFASEVANSEPHTIIRELQYPLIGGCRILPDHQLITTEAGGKIYPDPVKQVLSVPYSFKGPDQHFRQMGVKYPAGVASNCFALAGKTQGLYLGSHDPEFQDTWHGLRVYPDQNHEFNQLEVGFYKYPNCLPGQSWKNESNVVAPYSGNWHETSKLYRSWANSWWQHREEPQWVKDMLGFQRIIMRHQYGETFFTYSDLATRVKKAGESVGINVVFPFGWWNSGMDNGYPDSYFVSDPAQGGDAALKKAIGDFKQGGGKVILYYNGKLIDTESNFYRKGDGRKVSLNSNTGTEPTEAYLFSGPGTFTGYYDARSFVVADTKDTRWQRILYKIADHALEFGANSVFYDQLGYAEKTGKWDLTKEFPVPELRVIADKGNALKMIHDYIDTKDKEMAIGTEHITDVTSQYCDYVHSVFDLSSNNNFIAWFRYTFPEIILTDRNLDGDEPDMEWLVNQNVLLGLRNNLQIYRLRATIDETPHYQEYLAKVNRIRDRYRSLLVTGTFCDTEGFALTEQSVIGKSFVNGNQKAVVLTHRSGQRMTTEVDVPGYRLREFAGTGDFQVVEGTGSLPFVVLGKNSLVVIIYEK